MVASKVIVVLTVLAAIFSLAIRSQEASFDVSAPSGAVLLGNTDLDGGTDGPTVEQADVDPEGTPDMTGTITNKTGSVMGDITVRVRRKGTSGSGPTGGSITLSVPGGTASEMQTGSAIPGGNGGFFAEFDLDGSPGLPELDGNNSLDVDIDVTDLGDATEIEVRFTPSESEKPKGTSYHADIMEEFGFESGSTGVTHSLGDSGNDRITANVTNMDSSREIAKISGQVNFPGTNAIEAVYLQDPSNDFNEPAGADCQHTATTFAIDGFRNLRPGLTYEIVVVFETVPAEGDLKLAVNATFE